MYFVAHTNDYILSLTEYQLSLKGINVEMYIHRAIFM